jgi:hypothetical protein
MRTIFQQSHNEKDNLRLVGAYMSLQVCDYLTLYTLAKEITKTDIIRTQIENWVTQERAKEDEMTLVKKIVELINKQWKIEKAAKRGTTFQQFKENCAASLTRKEIDAKFIQVIINEIKA